MNRLLAVKPIAQACARQITTSQVKCKKPDLSKIKKKQAIFQADNDIPVYIKGGGSDQTLYYATVILVFTGVGMSFHSLYKLATHK